MKPLRLLGLFLLFFAPTAIATVVHVPADQPTIQSGVNAASPDDTVLVAPGTYYENLSLPAFDLVLSGSGMDSTTLKPADINQPLLQISQNATNASVVRGFNFEESGNSAALVIAGSSPIICFNRFFNCPGLSTSPAVLSADSTSAPVIHHNLLLYNNGSYQMKVDGPAQIYNNTIYAFRWIGVRVSNDSTVVVNNIIIDTEHRAIYGNASALADYNLILYDVYYDPPFGPHDYLFDPMFIDSAAGDFHLWISSPAIDAGHPDYKDSDGTPADLGALAVAGRPPAAWDIAFDSGTLNPNITWHYADTSTMSSQIGYELEIGLDLDWSVAELWATGEVASGATSTLYAGAPLADRGLYYYRLRLQNATGWGSWREGLFAVQIAPYRNIHVPAEIGTIQEAIFASAHGDTVSVAPGIYAGSFNRDLNFYGKDVVLYAPAGPDSTILDLGGTAEQQRHAVTFRNGEGPVAEMNGFTVTNGYGYINQYYQSSTIKIENSGPTIRNCRIVDNQGGGIELLKLTGTEDTLRVSGCEISRNTGDGISAGHSGVVRIDSSEFTGNGGHGAYTGSAAILRATNSLFVRNARNGIFSWFEMVPRGLYVTNCTFVGNATGLWCDWSFPKNTAPTATLQDSILTQIHNNVFAFNAVYGLRGYAPFSYRITCNNWFGNGTADAVISDFDPIDSVNNYSLNPLFCDTAADNYHLAEGSPCLPENNACTALIGAFGPGCGSCCLHMGDFDHDGGVNISDLTAFVAHLFRGGAGPTCSDEVDMNGDSQLAVSDLTALIAALFRGAEWPVCPGESPGW